MMNTYKGVTSTRLAYCRFAKPHLVVDVLHFTGPGMEVLLDPLRPNNSSLDATRIVAPGILHLAGGNCPGWSLTRAIVYDLSSSVNASRSNVTVLATGGTIASQGTSNTETVGHSVGLGVKRLVEAVPEPLVHLKYQLLPGL